MSSVAAWAQEAAPPSDSTANPFGRKYPARIYNTVKLKGPPPTIDGRLDDEAWTEGVWSGDWTQQMPVEGAAPSEQTQLKILYDDRNVYFAIRVYDDPALVHRYPGRRDAFTGDIVGVCFDSYNDKRTGFEFDLTAGGSKIDLVLGNGEFEWDTSWDAVWDGKVDHNDEGWTAEFRVPLSQLRFGSQDEQVWGLHSWRWIDRNQEEDEWQLIPRQNTGRMYQLGELHGLRNLPSQWRLELLPHVVGKASSGPSVIDSPDQTGSMGINAKLGLSTNFTLDATVNPDFGQVEADPSVVNLTAYETFYEEKRPFFLEGRKIMSFEADESDQLFYSRRIGHAPSGDPYVGVGETLLGSPETTTILSALKVTGKTVGGLSVGVLQSFTQKETARIATPGGTRNAAVEPFGSYTVARVQKDWDKGNTSAGGMVTSTHRWISDVGLEFLPTQSTTGGFDFARYFADRAWVLEAKGMFSYLTGDQQAIGAIQRNPVHYYQRPDADYLTVNDAATSLFGYGGSVRIGRGEQGRLRLSDRFLWYSPGLDFNDVGYLRQADVLSHQVSLGWAESVPRYPFRTYSFLAFRDDRWDFGGLHTQATTVVGADGTFENQWRASLRVGTDGIVDTRALRGGPALRLHSSTSVFGQVNTDPSRRLHASVGSEYTAARDDDSWSWRIVGNLGARLSNRLSLSGAVFHEALIDNLQYAASTTAATDGPRWILARLDQDTWNFTFRVDLSITPDFTVQYYGSPFIGTGRYTDFKLVTDPLAKENADRFHAFGASEITYDPTTNAYDATGTTGFANPDFSFRQFRSNLVVRWEWKPGSSVYLVWSQGRTGFDSSWEPSFRSNWDALWRAEADNVFLVKVSYWLAP